MNRTMTRPIALIGAAATVVATMTAFSPSDAPDPTVQPQTIPAVQEYAPGETAWQPAESTRVLVRTADAEALADDAQTLADELETETGIEWIQVVTTDGEPAAGDIVLALGAVDGTATEEAYRLTAGESVEIVGPSDTGVFWGTRTLLQSLRTGGGVGGVIVDEPGYAQRGLMVDVGRKYFTPEWLEERIRELSWLKMNTLHLHLSDNVGFRVELDSHPDIVDDPALTKADVAHLVEVAEQYHVTLIPEIDSPGHLDAALSTRPDLQLVRADGSVYAGHLDYSKPEARQFTKDIIGEIADMFPGPWFHIGGDEYYGAPWQPPAEHVTAANSPQLLEYARAATGSPDATLLDGFDAYMNELVSLLAEKGKRAKMWNDHVEPGDGVIDVDRSVQVDSWVRWRNWLPGVEDFINAGYDVVNRNGDHLYFILTEGGRNETGKKSPSGLYELWTPRTVMRTPGQDAVLAENLPLGGAIMSIWADQPDSMTEEEVAAEAGLWFRSFAQNIWDSPKSAPTWNEFAPMIEAIGTAPVPSDAPEPTADFPWTATSPAVLHAAPQAGDPFAITDTTKIFVDSPQTADSAALLASGLARAAGLSALPEIVESGTPAAGDVVLTVGDPDLSGVEIPAKGADEAYRIDIDGVVRVEGATADAVARGVTTLAKATRAQAELSPVTVVDAPAYAERSVMLDVGRKYYSPDWVKDFIREMSWNQLNTLHLHLNDNEGFRVVVPSYPNTASPDAWSADELAEILAVAEEHHVEVIPEIDGPGHMDWILRNYPQFQLQLSSGAKVTKALDYSNPEAAEFLRTIISDTMAMFPDSERFHIGGDEYFLTPITSRNTPQLLAYARQVAGSSQATVHDGATHFINELGAFVASQGKQPRVWNDGVDLPNALVPLDTSIEVEIWSVWGHNWREMNAQDFIDQGYTVVNAHGDYYFIIRENWDNLTHDKHSPRGIYDNWQPNGFMNDAGGSTSVIPAENEQQLGAGIHVWADDPDYWTPEEVWDQLVPWLLPLGQRTWDSPEAPATFAELSETAFALAHPTSAPMAPAELSLVASAGGASAQWQPPVSAGGDPVTGYTVVWTVDGQVQPGVELAAGDTSARLDGLAEGASVSVEVFATNALGTSVRPATAGPTTVPGETVAVEVTAETRCIASKAYITVRATNGENVPISLTMQSEFGEKSFASIAAGKHATHAFASRAPSVPAGDVTVTATLDGTTASSTGTVEYEARSCG